MVVETIQEIDKRTIETIIQGMECNKNFECYKSCFQNICKVKATGQNSFLKCLGENPSECEFSLPSEDEYFCLCSLRLYISKRWNK